MKNEIGRKRGKQKRKKKKEKREKARTFGKKHFAFNIIIMIIFRNGLSKISHSNQYLNSFLQLPH